MGFKFCSNESRAELTGHLSLRRVGPDVLARRRRAAHPRLLVWEAAGGPSTGQSGRGSGHLTAGPGAKSRRDYGRRRPTEVPGQACSGGRMRRQPRRDGPPLQFPAAATRKSEAVGFNIIPFSPHWLR